MDNYYAETVLSSVSNPSTHARAVNTRDRSVLAAQMTGPSSATPSSTPVPGGRCRSQQHTRVEDQSLRLSQTRRIPSSLIGNPGVALFLAERARWWKLPRVAPPDGEKKKNFLLLLRGERIKGSFDLGQGAHESKSSMAWAEPSDVGWSLA